MKSLKTKQISKGVLEELIESKKKYSISIEIHPCTIHSCVYKGRSHTPESHGVNSPLVATKEALVQTCAQMGKIRQLLNVTKGIALMSGMVCNTLYKEALVNFHEALKLGSESFEYSCVMLGWWKGFKKQNHT
eukprot:15365883-Ditylum_brightwellii.AAC.1